MFAQVSPIALQLTPQPPQYALLVRSRHTPPQQRCHVPPHDVPSATVREQLRVSVNARLPHDPVAQVRSVRVRDCVPVLSHALLKPPQLPHAL